MRFKISLMTSAVLIVLHMLIIMWYYQHSHEWFILHRTQAQVWFNGIGFVIIGANYLISSLCTGVLQCEFNKYYGAFLFSLGIIYTLHYTGIVITTKHEKLGLLSGVILIIFVVMLLSARTHGLFKNKK